MNFFIPGARNDRETHEVFENIKSFAETTTGWDVTDRKIFSIQYRHSGKHYTAEVGQQEQHTKEIVIAILESNAFLVCTPNRGVIRNMPILVGKDAVYSTVDFE